MSDPIVFIPLGRGFVATVDFDDYDLLRGFKWYAGKRADGRVIAARTEYDPVKYSEGKTYNKTVLMHRQIAAKMGFRNVDHKDMDTLNNQRENLRPCSQSQNKANCGLNITNTSGFKGVSWHIRQKAWTAKIKVCQKPIFLGYFDTAEKAARAYDAAAKKYFGEFARLNLGDFDTAEEAYEAVQAAKQQYSKGVPTE